MKSKKFGLYIRKLRKENELSLKQLTKLLIVDDKTISVGYVNTIESSGQIPHVKVIKKLATTFKIDSKILFDLIKEDNKYITDIRIKKNIGQAEAHKNRIIEYNDERQDKLKSWKQFNKLMAKIEINLDFLDSNFGW